MKAMNINRADHPAREPRYGADCTFAATHGGVTYGTLKAPWRAEGSWNSMTIPCPCALPCIAANAHSTPAITGF